MHAAIVGANGYAGMVLMRILLQHPEIKQVIPASRSLAGTGVQEYDPGLPAGSTALSAVAGRFVAPDSIMDYQPDAVFSALPHLVSADLCADLIGKVPLFDLSADFRLRSDDRFLAAYGQPRPQPDLQDRAAYGLVEWYRPELQQAELVACPGCYPTAVLLPLIPLLRHRMIQGTIVVNAMSGITGAGKKAATRLIFAERSENMEPYLAGRSHRHWNEIEQEIQRFWAAEETRTAHPTHMTPTRQPRKPQTVQHRNCCLPRT